MWTTIATLISLATLASPGRDISAKTPRAAQALLAQALGDADSVDWVRADAANRVVVFGIDRAGEAYEVVATTKRSGVVDTVSVRDVGRGSHELGDLSWLADVMEATDSVKRLVIDERDQVTLIAGDGTAYLAITGHGPYENSAVEARWAAAWDS